MITIPDFYRVCEKHGFRVFKDYPYKDFYKIYYEDNNSDIGFSVARLIKFNYGNEVTLYRPEGFSFLAPMFCTTDKRYSDIKEFEKDLMVSYFTFRKYLFDYNMREHTSI